MTELTTILAALASMDKASVEALVQLLAVQATGATVAAPSAPVATGPIANPPAPSAPAPVATGPAPSAPSAPVAVKPSAGPADGKSVARGILDAISKAGKVWAGRTWNVVGSSAIDGHVFVDTRGTYVFVLGVVVDTTATDPTENHDSGMIVAKKIGPTGEIYGQTVLREFVSLGRDLGVYRGARAHVSAIAVQAPAPAVKAPAPAVKAPAAVAVQAPAPAPSAPAAVQAPAPSAPAATGAGFVVPDGATHLVLVQPNGEDCRFKTGAILALDVRGETARSILAGTHPRWSRRIAKGGFGVRFLS